MLFTHSNKMLREFGYRSSAFRVSLEEDEDEILQTTKQLLLSSAGTNIVLSISDNPCQAQDLLDLFDKVSQHRVEDTSVLPGSNI